MGKDSNPGRAFLGFLLTFFTTISLIGLGLVSSLKMSILNCSDIDEFLENADFYSTVHEVVVSEIKNKVSDMTTGESMDGGLTEDVVDSLLTEDVVKDMTSQLTNAITKEEEIDLTSIKDKCVDNVTDLSDKAIDDIFNEISKNSDVIDASSLSQSEILKQYEKDYNIDISTMITDELTNKYGEPSVNLNEIDINKVKEETKSVVMDTAIPLIEKNIDEYIEEANTVVNAQVSEIRDSGDVKKVTSAFNLLLEVAKMTLIVSMILVIVFSILQIFAVYGKCKNRAFRNIAISSVIVSIIMLSFGMTVSYVNRFIGMAIEDETSGQILKPFIQGNISKIAGDMYLIGGILAIIFVACTGAAIYIKKHPKLSEVDNGLFE